MRVLIEMTLIDYLDEFMGIHAPKRIREWVRGRRNSKKG